LAFRLLYAEGHVEREPERAIFVRCHWCKLERNLRLFCEKSRERSPSDRDIDIAVCYSFDNLCRWILPCVITVQGEATYVFNDAAPRQCVRGWRVDAVVTDQLHADLELAQLRITE